MIAKSCYNRGMTDLTKIPEADLDPLCWHEVPVRTLCRLSNPLAACIEIDRPITRKEVRSCIAAGLAQMTTTPLWTSAMNQETETTSDARSLHIQKIAHFVVHGHHDPIAVDVGIPSMGCWPSHLVQDGNHRLAAAWIRGDKTIKATICGSVDHAQELGLWAPSPAEQERWRRFNKKTNRPR